MTEELKISTKLYLATMILLGGVALHFDDVLTFVKCILVN